MSDMKEGLSLSPSQPVDPLGGPKHGPLHGAAASALTNVGNACPLEDVVIHAVQPLDLLALVGDHLLPAVRRRRTRVAPPKALAVGELVRELGRIDEQLLGDAASDHTAAWAACRGKRRDCNQSPVTLTHAVSQWGAHSAMINPISSLRSSCSSDIVAGHESKGQLNHGNLGRIELRCES